MPHLALVVTQKIYDSDNSSYVSADDYNVLHDLNVYRSSGSSSDSESYEGDVSDGYNSASSESEGYSSSGSDGVEYIGTNFAQQPTNTESIEDSDESDDSDGVVFLSRNYKQEPIDESYNLPQNNPQPNPPEEVSTEEEISESEDEDTKNWVANTTGGNI